MIKIQDMGLAFLMRKHMKVTTQAHCQKEYKTNKSVQHQISVEKKHEANHPSLHSEVPVSGCVPVISSLLLLFITTESNLFQRTWVYSDVCQWLF